MRDPKRIKKIIGLLQLYWEDHPDLRLGQIISNCVRLHDGRLNCDPFYIEDNDMEKALLASIDRDRVVKPQN